MSRSEVGGRALFDPQSLPVLVVDDEADNLDAFRFSFRKGFRILTAQSAEAGLQILSQEKVAVIVADQRMPKMTGLQFLETAQRLVPLAVPIIVTAYTDVDVLIEAINSGHIYRYITKPWDSKELRGVLLQALERYHLLVENARLQKQLEHYAGYLEKELHGAADFGQLVGESAALRAALLRVEQVARTDATVLLRGESGTGKELVAHAIHINSRRSNRPFVRVNCAALASGVLESELFGHERGAFTGAMARHPGRFELADGGTIFLDEVGDLPMEVQVKLLRVLQERSFERVGGSETLHVDVRVISATHKDLEAMIAAGTFREDLYYRLNVFPIVLPPLRDRLEDLPMLCQHFLHKWRKHAAQRVTQVSQQALAYLAQYDFPGNVRELENLIERALILAVGSEITPAELEFVRPSSRSGMSTGSPSRPPASAPVVVASPPPPSAPAPNAPTEPLSRTLSDRLLDQERAEILSAIERADGNIAQAARLLGYNRSTLYYRLRKHDLLHLLPTKPELLAPLP